MMNLGSNQNDIPRVITVLEECLAININDKISENIGIEIIGGVMKPMIKRMSGSFCVHTTSNMFMLERWNMKNIHVKG